jgi:hypothetical protein
MQPSSPHQVATEAAPFTLSPRGHDYWYCDELEPLLASLRARADLHEWATASRDKKSYKEITRFYHKWPHYHGRVEPSGIVLDRGTDGGVWLRLVGTDLARARRILETLQTGQAVEEVQSCLF